MTDPIAAVPEAPAVEFRHVAKIYSLGRRGVAALDGVSFAIRRCEFVIITGPSGSGKSTLLHLAGCLDLPTSGEVLVEGHVTKFLDDTRLTLLRRRAIGFVLQFFNLIPTLDAVENVSLPGLLNNQPGNHVRGRAEELLRRLGLGGRLDHYPDELSGGEMQRVAIARALITNPSILLADEPTGNLDSASGLEVLGILKDLSREHAVVVVTHDEKVAQYGTRVLRLRDGRLEA
jgi:putative ABC transport system ATP-binding protein